MHTGKGRNDWYISARGQEWNRRKERGAASELARTGMAAEGGRRLRTSSDNKQATCTLHDNCRLVDRRAQALVGQDT